MSGQGKSLSSETPDTICILRNNKRKKNPDTSIYGEKPIQEPVNPIKRAKENTSTYLKKGVLVPTFFLKGKR